MSDGYISIIAMGAFLLVGAVFGGSVAGAYVEADFRADAIERGYAQYCAKSGDWAWKGECDGEAGDDGE